MIALVLVLQCAIENCSMCVVPGVSLWHFRKYLYLPYRGVQPHFDYCNVVWDNCSISLSEKLHRLQNPAACILMSGRNDCNVNDLFRALGWHKLKPRLMSTSIMMYQTVHGMTPEYLRSRFVSRDDITSYQLRSTENKFAYPQPIPII